MNSNFLNIHDSVLILTFAECLFITFLLRILPAVRYQSRQLLSAFFLLSAGWVVSTLLSWNIELKTLWINQSIFSPVLISISLLLQGPCLYLYFCSLTEHINFRRKSMLLHTLPTALAVFAIILFNVDGTAWLLKTPLPHNQEVAARFAWAIIRCSPIFYIILCFYAVRNLREHLSQMYSSISTIEFKWAYYVLLGFFIHWLWAFFQFCTGNFLSYSTNYWMGNFEDYLIVLQINCLLVLGLKNTRELLNVTQPIMVKTTESALNEAPLDAAKIQLVEKAIHEQKFYLENNINLDRFSELVGLKSRDLSSILHGHYHLNFFEFINGLRLEEAKRLLVATECADVSILDVIYQSGFNSQSAFQRFFKSRVGCTPTEYRRNAQQAKNQPEL